MCLATVALFAALLCAVQGTVYVDLNSNDSLGSSESPYVTIGEGLGATIYGGTIIVNDGVYKGLGNKNLNISSSSLSLSSVNGPSKTIIDCENDGYGIDLFNGGGFYLTGFTIRNCYRHFQNPNRSSIAEGNYGGGALSVHSTYTVLTNIRLENNNATGLGGAIYIYSDSVEIYNSTIINNNVIGVGGGVFIQSANLKIGNDTVIESNKASQNGSDLFCISASVELLDKASDISSITCASCSVSRNNTQLCPHPGSGSSAPISSAANLIAVLVILAISCVLPL